MDNKVYKFEKAALDIRKDLLKLCTMQVIHIGGDLSIADVMTVLWQYKMKFNANNPKYEKRDRFVLSKGHASAVLSFNQAAIGCFDKELIYKEYAQDNGRFSMHSCNLINPYIEVSTGSLGHGMPVAAGIAAALKLKGNNESRVYTVMGDGEQSEGSVWEAAMNAAKYRLGNLIAIIDYNNLEADGFIDDVTSINSLADKYRAFNWNVVEINGNNVEEVINALDSLPDPDSDIPTAVICHTVKGKGVEFMENEARWHAGKISKEDYYSAVKKLEEEFDAKWGVENESR